MRQEQAHKPELLEPSAKDGPRQALPAWFLFALMALMLASSLGFLWLGQSLAPGSRLPEAELRILDRVFDRIEQQYIYPLDEERKRLLIHRAIQGMVRDLDDYSRYMPPAQHETYNRQTKGILSGIGVIVQDSSQGPIILYPLAQGPAERAGVRVGDVIRAVDGTAIKTQAEALKLIKGKPKTEVRLDLLGADAQLRQVVVTRGTVRIPATRWVRLIDAEQGLGYVYLARFSERTVGDLDQAIQELQAELGRPLRGLVLDLRHNLGGLLDPALTLCNRFIPEGTLLTVEARGQEPVVHVAEPERCRYPDLPLVVLIDGDSASASEVVAGALQDYGRARIVGERSYGKGVVNSVFSWPERKERLKLTTAYYVTPKGRNIESHLRIANERGKGGIAPDVEVLFEKAGRKSLLQLRLRRREAPRAYRAALAKLAAAHEDIRVSQAMGLDEDKQLRAAREELRAQVLQAHMKPAGGDHRPQREDTVKLPGRGR